MIANSLRFEDFIDFHLAIVVQLNFAEPPAKSESWQ